MTTSGQLNNNNVDVTHIILITSTTHTKVFTIAIKYLCKGVQHKTVEHKNKIVACNEQIMWPEKLKI